MGYMQQNHGVEMTKPVDIFIRMSHAQIDRHEAVGCKELTAMNLLHVSDETCNLDSKMSWNC